MLALNVYEDVAGKELFGEDFLDFAGDPEWQEVVNNYKGHALEQAKQIKEYAAKGRTLTSAEAEYAENTWYDGSDSYNDIELALEYLPQTYDAQLEAVEEILHGNIEGMHEANQGGKTEHSGAKKGKGAYYGRKKEAKRDSNKNRRSAGKDQSKEIREVTTEDGITYSLGTVEVTVFDDEISLKHGHGQNIFLSREEFSDFVRGISHNNLVEGEIEEGFNPRESTVALHELMDEGILDARTVADACLNYMSEAEVDDMASDNSFFGDE